MTTLTARNVMTGAAMLQLIAEHAGLAPRDFSTGAWLDKLDPALDITARDIVTGAYVDKLAGTESTPSSLMLVPTGAIQSADGIYQRFVYDGIHATEVEPDTFFPNWYADLPTNARQHDYQIAIKVPSLGVIQQFSLLIVDAESDIFMTDPAAVNHLSLDFNGGELTRVGLNIVGDPSNSMRPALDPQPVAGDIITLTLSGNTLVYAWSGGSDSIAIPSGFFTNAPNVLVYSAGTTASNIVDLSIKVSNVEAQA